MTAGVLTRRLLLLMERLNAEGEDGLHGVGTALVAIVCAVLLLFCSVIYILTSPIEFTGELGEFQNRYSYLVATEDSATGGAPLTEEDIAAIVSGIADPRRREIVAAALSLVGRVPYFWGGKSSPGWNDAWNTLKRVTAPGVSSSGTLRPYGLDCSGFTDWAYQTAGMGPVLAGGAHYQFWHSEEIDESDLEPGDLVFKNYPDNEIINHVGIYLGEGLNGGNLYIHCSSSAGGVVVNDYSGFQLFRRPPFLDLPWEEAA